MVNARPSRNRVKIDTSARASRAAFSLENYSAFEDAHRVAELSIFTGVRAPSRNIIFYNEFVNFYPQIVHMTCNLR